MIHKLIGATLNKWRNMHSADKELLIWRILLCGVVPITTFAVVQLVFNWYFFFKLSLRH